MIIKRQKDKFGRIDISNKQFEESINNTEDENSTIFNIWMDFKNPFWKHAITIFGSLFVLDDDDFMLELINLGSIQIINTIIKGLQNDAKNEYPISYTEKLFVQK